MTIATYCSDDELKDELGGFFDNDDGLDDDRISRSIAAASRMIDQYCAQRFWQDDTAVARTFAPYDTRCLRFSDDGISDASTVVVKLDLTDTGTYGTTLSTTDYILRPTNAAVQIPARPFTEIYMTGVSYQFGRSAYGRDLVQITAKWGWPAVPDEVKKACLIQAADLYKAKDAVFGVAGGSEFGVLRVTSGLHRMAESLLMPYRRMVGFA